MGYGGTILATKCGGRLDRAAPTASVKGADSSWHRRDVTLTFSGRDDSGGVGVNFLQSRVDDGRWRTGSRLTLKAPADHANDGVHKVSYRASIRRATRARRRPSPCASTRRARFPKALGDKKVRRGSVVQLPYRIDDPSPGCGYASVSISFYRIPAVGRASFVTQRRLGIRRTNRSYSYRFTCTLPRGSYLYVVKATDKAGNRSAVSIEPGSPVVKRISDRLTVDP